MSSTTDLVTVLSDNCGYVLGHRKHTPGHLGAKSTMSPALSRRQTHASREDRGWGGSDEVEGAPGIWASPGTNYTGADV